MSRLFERFAGSDIAATVLFLALFLIIVGGALFLTPRIARWVDRQKRKHPGFYDGMMEQAPEKEPEKKREEDGGERS